MTVLETNQAFNFPYYGFDWTPHETEAQVFSNLISQSNASFRYGAGHEEYADKNIFDWMFAQFRAENRIDDLKEIVADLDIVGGNRNAQMVKLNQAERFLLDTKHDEQAINMLNAFISQINAFVNSDTLTEEQAIEMIFAAEETIRYINYINNL
ncbi:FIMAH domain-containing protein [Gracilibacillus salitolerans]|uniref:FIMAH domain-containing protein n=1 Tax=Gracilibacillus salitolerans TaxID=2663022 RepID=UPI001E46E2A6|nr:hypothetical protein [Gracilibacillus salitolerans]